MKLLVILLTVVAILLVLWNIQANKMPAAQYSNHNHHWFVAIKSNGNPMNDYTLAQGVKAPWQTNGDLGFIVKQGTDPYWDLFMLLTGEHDTDAPITFDNHVTDAYLVRLKPYKAPPLALSFFYALHKIGILKASTIAPTPNIENAAVRVDIAPSRESVHALFDRPFEQKAVMVNFLKFYDKSQYSDKDNEQAPDITGREAYDRYGKVAAKVVFSVGGRYVIGGKVIDVLRPAKHGPSVGDWDDIAIIQYPSQTGILTMGQVPEYNEALRHRNAGLERTVIIASKN